MKKKLLNLSIVICLIALFSCNEKYGLEDHDANKSKEPLTEIGNLVPYLVEENENDVVVGLSPYAQAFHLDLTREYSQEYLNLLNQARKEEIPVRVYVLENTKDIYLVEALSTEEVTAFRAEIKKDIEEHSQSELRFSRVRLLIALEEGFANELFEEIKSNQNIPFYYLSDGCHARAHKMVQVLTQKQVYCKKIWMYGDLAASSENKPDHCARWRFHVAVLITLSIADEVYPGTFYIQDKDMVMDPSLFNRLVTPEEWRNACLNKFCLLNAFASFTDITESNVYLRFPDRYDDNYIDTDRELSIFR